MVRRLAPLCLLFVCVPALAQDPLPADVRGLEKLTMIIDRVSQVQRKTVTLKAEFEQRRVSRLLREPSVSQGTMYFRAPDTVRWEYLTPRPMTVLLSEGVATTYRPTEKRAERVEFGRVQRKIVRFMGAGEPLEELRRYFSFTFRDPGPKGNYELLLAPTAHQIKKRISQLQITIDRDRFIPTAFSYTEKDGDLTSYAFSNVIINGTLPDSLFELKLPTDVEVVEIKARGTD